MNASKSVLFLILAAGVASVPLAQADTVKFPGADAVKDAQGRYDLSLASNWDGGVLPGAAAEVSITGTPAVVVTASGDVDFGQVWNGITINNYASTHRTLTFDMTGQATPPRINAKGYRWVTGGARYHDTYFKGGYYDLGGGVFCNNGSSLSYLNYSNLGISDGAIITNANSMFLGYTGQVGQHIDICGNSKVYINGGFSFQVYGGDSNHFTPESWNYLKIYDGAHFEVNACNWERSGDNVSLFTKKYPLGEFKDFLIVSNATMTMKSGNSTLSARGYTFTHITDHATVTAKDSLLTAQDLACGGLLRIDNGGCLNAKTVYGGWDNGVVKWGSNSNRVEVLEDGVLNASGTFYLCYSRTEGHTLFVSNGTFCCQQFMWNNNDIERGGSRVILSGSKASFSVAATSSYALFGFSPSCEFVVENGATYTPPTAAFGYTTTFLSNDVLRVRTGGKLKGVLFNTASGITTASPAQTLSTDCGTVIEDAGEVECTTARVCGKRGFLRVDDGKLTIAGDSSSSESFFVGFQGVYGGLTTNCTLTIAGSHPQIKNTKNMAVMRGSKVVFELPPEGYEEGIVPLDISADMPTWSAGCGLEFVGGEEMVKRHEELGKRTRYTLMRVPSGRLFAVQNILSTVTLPKGLTLAVVTEGGYKNLVLSVKPSFGLSVLVR